MRNGQIKIAKCRIEPAIAVFEKELFGDVLAFALQKARGARVPILKEVEGVEPSPDDESFVPHTQVEFVPEAHVLRAMVGSVCFGVVARDVFEDRRCRDVDLELLSLV
jgi:hypothetical protein